jgi:uncharacterized protein YcfJ
MVAKPVWERALTSGCKKVNHGQIDVERIVAGAAAVVAIGGIAGYEASHRQPTYADVLKTELVLETIKTPRQVCKDEAVTRKAPVQDRERIAGTAIGRWSAVLGHQIVGGSGRNVAMVAGAALGGYAGRSRTANWCRSKL